MRAIVVTAWGGADVLAPRDIPAPRPGPGQALVDVAVAGVNFRDIYERQGPPQGWGGTPPPFVAGIEGVGRISEVGSGVAGLAVGDRVAWWFGQGSYAEQVVVDAAQLVPVPNGVDDAAASAVIQGLTAHALAHSVHPLEAGDWVLVQAGAGGVALLLTQMLNHRGVRVLATTSTADKAAQAREAGAEVVIGYDAVPERVRDVTGDGVAAVFDAVGKDTFEASLASLRPRGLLALYGQASGGVPAVDFNAMTRSVFVTRFRLPDYTQTREELLRRASEVFQGIAEKAVSIRIASRYPLEQAALAQRDIEQRRSVGKVVLDVRSGMRTPHGAHQQ